MSTPSFLAQQEQQQQQCSLRTGNNAIMSMMNSRQHSRLTANIYGNQNNNVLNQNANVAPTSLPSMPPQQQLVNSGNYIVNNRTTNSMDVNAINTHGYTISGNHVNNNTATNINGHLAQKQVQIAGLNGITFTLPPNSVAPLGPVAPPHLTSGNSTIDALTLSSLNGTVPEFLFQLTKMLTDEGNKEVIVWNSGMGIGNHQFGGRIEVHSPKRMEEEVLGKYFRHSKYASFQRQLNYFGFRKIAGKGKMSPCSYVNDMVTSDIRSLLLIKRKGTKGTADEESLASSDVCKSSSSNNTQSDKSTVLSSNEDKNEGKKRRSMPDSNIVANVNQPLSVMALGPAPTLGRNIQDNAKKPKVDFCVDNHYINVTDNNSLGIVTSNGIAGGGNSIALAHSNSLLNAYNMAVGKGVNDQLNNFMNQNSSIGTVVTNNASSQNSASTSVASSARSTFSVPFVTNNSSHNSYMAHTSSQHALSAPAPMLFLDPSELGMSIESSLNELKNNFKAANRDTVVDSSKSSAHPNSHASKSHASEHATIMPAVPSKSKTFAPSSIPANDASIPTYSDAHLGSSAKVPTQMLSHEDSLVNLAMLPTMESCLDVPSYSSFFTSNLNKGDTGAFLQRNDSLIELAASVENNTNSTAVDKNNNTAPNESRFECNDDPNADTFSFIDFPGQM